MKKVLVLFLLFLTTLFSADIVWQKDLKTAFEVAKKEKKVVMLLVEGEHCRWCKKMKHRTLNDEKVGKRLEPYIAVKVMQEDEDAVKDLPMINGVPTIFFMTAEKEVIETVVGYFNVEDFLSYIDDVEKKVPLKKKVKKLLTLKWNEEIDDAFIQARAEHKKVMVMVEDEHCRWCVKMKKGALSDPGVKKELQKYVLLKIDRADEDDMKVLPDMRGPIPSFHLLSTDKKSLDKLAGYYDTGYFFEYLSKLAEEY